MSALTGWWEHAVGGFMAESWMAESLIRSSFRRRSREHRLRGQFLPFGQRGWPPTEVSWQDACRTTKTLREAKPKQPNPAGSQTRNLTPVGGEPACPSGSPSACSGSQDRAPSAKERGGRGRTRRSVRAEHGKTSCSPLDGAPRLGSFRGVSTDCAGTAWTTGIEE